MSIRTALTWTIVGISLLGTAAIATLGASRIRSEVVRVAQARVDHDLEVLVRDYDRRLDAFGARFAREVRDLDPDAPDLGALLARRAETLDLEVVGLLAPDGRRLAGPSPPDAPPAPLAADPVLRRASGGRPAWGTVQLDAARLRAEGGQALAAAATLVHEGRATPTALAWWAATPLKDAEGRIRAIVHGGRLLNHDLALVDDLGALAYGGRRYEGKPVGTVTLFVGPVRAATNVLDREGRRAVGTRVSDVVARSVLEEGRRWSDRAYVVDTWYLSAYAPLRDPDDAIVGMLYVGLLEEPFADAQRERLLEFLLLLGGVALLAIAAVTWLVRRITRPLARLGTAAEAFARHEWDHALDLPRTYAEIRRLADTLEEMRGALVERDAAIRRRSAELADANASLARVNRNYMETLGFVTHELKAPLAAIQMMSQLLTDRFGENLPEGAERLLLRIRRNGEELQGMVKDYLDLSRAERGELEAEPVETDLRADVLDAALAQSEPLLRSREMTVEVDAPPTLPARADPELLRIAVANLLSNAAKYGRPGGRVRLEARRQDGHIEIAVTNEGPGFDAAEGARLFGRFVRLRNANTRDKRGSGLGLYLVRRIAEQHGGTADATSEPGAWARFRLLLEV